MFIPIGDDNRDRRTTPYVNYLFILLNIVVFIFLQKWGNDLGFTFSYATVPGEILTGRDIVTENQVMQDPISGQQFVMPGLQPTSISVYLTLLTSMFMHGGTAHLLGNMLYLWVFGDNIEDRMGHTRYFFFYLLCGILASLSHIFTSAFFGQGLLVPSLGASGAISGVLGGYILLFPRKRVQVWVFWFILSVPAFITVGLWFAFQVINGMGVLGGEEAGGIAYAAHIGGFIAGLVFVHLFIRQPKLQEERETFW
ncbi:MAG: rhomboid family intramembrane serine protease [Candidatus Dadabacteria bacterium]